MPRNVRSIAAGFGLATMLAISTVAMTPSPAAAVLSDCTKGPIPGTSAKPSSAWARCELGVGQVRAWIECWDDFGHKQRFYGVWRGPHTASWAYCNSRYYSYDRNGYQVR